MHKSKDHCNSRTRIDKPCSYYIPARLILNDEHCRFSKNLEMHTIMFFKDWPVSDISLFRQCFFTISDTSGLLCRPEAASAEADIFAIYSRNKSMCHWAI